MRTDRFDGTKSGQRRPNRQARGLRPGVDSLEGRQMLTTYVLIDNPTIVEGTGGTKTMNFTVRLSAPAATTVSVDYTTSNITAVAGSDFLAASGNLSFSPGEVTKTVPVSIVGDSQVELTEAFGLNLSKPQNAVLAMTRGIGAVLDDDTVVAPKLTIGDVVAARGLSGTRTIYLPVSLNTAASTPVSVRVRTSDATARAGTDYLAVDRVLTFAPGETIKLLPVTVYGTSVATSDKIFTVRLSEASVELSRSNAAGILKFGA